MNEAKYIGGCLCGSVRYEATGQASDLCYCHCASCRRAAGAPVVPWGTFARKRFTVTGGRLTEYRSSPEVTRGFCAKCGTLLTYCHEQRPSEIDVTLATLDDSNLLAPQAHIWVQYKLPWVVINDGLPQFDEDRTNV